MSADNWATCPQCQSNAFKELRGRQQKAEEAYGKVSEAEYLRLKEQAKEPITFESSSLREDYELYIDVETWTFKVSYQASCDVCGFNFNYKHTQSVRSKS